MQYIKFITLAILIIAIVACSIILIIRYVNKKKSKQEKLFNLDERFLNDPSIYHGGIYIKDLSNNTSHIVKKGDIHNKTFYLTSVTKLFTHAIIFQLIDENILEYEGTISNYLDEREWSGILRFKEEDYSGTITIRDLLDQTSGLCDYESEFLRDGKHIFEALSEEDFAMCYESAIDATRSLNPIHKPGLNESAYYSNLNALLLGRIAEVSLKKSLDLIFKEKIFDPLNLNNTFIAKNSVSVVPIHFNGESKNPIKYFSSALASSGLISNLDDTMKFIEGFFNGKLFDKKHIKDIDFKPIQFRPIKYGRGIMKVRMSPILCPLYDKPTIYGHSGSSGSFAYYLKKRNIFIVGTLNQVKSNPYKYIYGYLDAFN